MFRAAGVVAVLTRSEMRPSYKFDAAPPPNKHGGSYGSYEHGQRGHQSLALFGLPCFLRFRVGCIEITTWDHPSAFLTKT